MVQFGGYDVPQRRGAWESGFTYVTGTTDGLFFTHESPTIGMVSGLGVGETLGILATFPLTDLFKTKTPSPLPVGLEESVVIPEGTTGNGFYSSVYAYHGAMVPAASG